MKEIFEERRRIDKERRELIEKLLEPYIEDFRKRTVELMKKCEETTGHKFNFSHLGPLGHAWHYCNYCGKSKVEGYD
jgi:hypothetical protein